MKIILASKSGVRKKILDQNNIINQVVGSNVNEDEVKVSRVLDRSKSEKRKTGFSSKTELQAAWIIEVENLSDIEKKVRLADRIPVSQNDEIKVRSIKIAPKVAPDEKGLFSSTVLSHVFVLLPSR